MAQAQAEGKCTLWLEFILPLTIFSQFFTTNYRYYYHQQQKREWLAAAL